MAVALLASRVSYVPTWDGRIYARCLVDAAREPWAPGAFRCGGHASHLFVLSAIPVVRLFAETYAGVLVVNALWFAAAVAGFHRLGKLVFPADELRLDRALLTAAFVIQPSFLAAVVQPGLDLPLMAPFLWTIVFLLTRRWVAVVAMGMLLAFTKETGVLLYAIVVACFGLYRFATATGTWRERAVALLRLVPLTAPAVAFLLNIAYRKLLAPEQRAIWFTSTANLPLWHQFLVPRLDLHLIAYLDLMLILNFAWVFTAILLADAFVGSVRGAHRLERRNLPGTDRWVAGLLAVVCVALGVALTRYVSYAFTRYVLAFMAVLPVVALASLLRLGVRTNARRFVLSATALLLAVSTVRTIDPVSRWLWGTFPVGARSMLRMTSITGECCGAGQDHLAYSLEFTTIVALENQALAAIRPSLATPIVLPDSAYWYTDWRALGELDASTGMRTVRRSHTVFTPNTLSTQRFLRRAELPDSAHFIALPNGNVPSSVRDLSRLYVFGPEQRVHRGSYWLSYYAMTSRKD